MATYYVSSVDGSDSDNGTTWALAVATLKYAVETLAATGGPHTILVDSAHSEVLSADLTITAAQDLRIISVNRSGADAPTVGAIIGSQTTAYAITLVGAWNCYFFGISFRAGTAAANKEILVGNASNGQHFEFEQCSFHCAGGAAAHIYFGATGSIHQNFCALLNCTFRLGATGQQLRVRAGSHYWRNCSYDAAGSAPTTAFISYSSGYNITCEGCDFSHLGAGTLVGDPGDVGTPIVHTFINCRIGTGTIMAAPTTILNRSQIEVFLWNCANADQHYHMFHGDAFGTTEVVTNIHATDGASYDGSNRCSWKITTRASNCSFYTPYVSPWIEQYNGDTSTAITPYLEGLRDGSATVIQDDEVWAEFSRQGTSGSPLAVFSNDRMALLGTPANQTSTFGAGDWTGEGGTFSTFKLQAPAAFTPAEIGPLKARVIVGEPGLTIYVDPQIRT